MIGWQTMVWHHGVRSSKGRAANGNIIFATFPHDIATPKWFVNCRDHKSERERKGELPLLYEYELDVIKLFSRG